MSRGNDLPSGYCLHEYEITKTLAAGGFGVTYVARDRNLDKEVAIKEFFPLSLAMRLPDNSIGPSTTTGEMKQDYEHLLHGFIDEARRLGKFEHPNVLRVLRYVEANDTAYIITEYISGPTLLDKIKQEEFLDEATLRPILLALIDGLRAVHAHGMLHRDIKPANIILRDGKTPVLIDFGASREAFGKRGHSVTMMWTPGYAPFEQISDDTELGPYSDIYALGATAYMAVVGKPPADCAGRILNDRMEPAVIAAKDRASHAFLAAIDWAIKPHAKDRPQNVDEWLAAFRDENFGNNSADAETVILKPTSTRATETKVTASPEINSARETQVESSTRGKGIAVALVAVFVIAAVALWFSLSAKKGDVAPQSSSEQAAAMSEPATSTQPAAQAESPQQEPAAQVIANESVQEAPAQPIDATDDEDFKTARLVDSSEAYQLYLRIHPKGSHIGEAQSALHR